MCLRTRAPATLLLCISSCVFSGFSFARDVPFRRTEIDSAFQGDGKAIGDMDGDGLADIVVAGQKLVWYRAPGWAKTTIASGVDFGTDIQVGDVDNDGKGNFDGHLVDSGKETHLGARVFDLDGDGDFDILGHCWDTPQYLHMWRNDALGSVATNPAAGNKGEESVSIDRMRQCRAGHVTLVYAPESERIARDIVRYAARCNQRLAQWFQPASPVAQKVYWMARKDWRNKPETYGFPYANGSDAYLPASDVDLPTQLAILADSMALSHGGPPVDRMVRLLQLPQSAGPEELYAHLKQSREFFCVLTAYFILPHELTHGFCNHLAYPQQPRWCYEGIAQWAAYKIQGQLRSPREADMIDQYYQLLWERATDLKVRDFARADELGLGGLDTPNYAWYHAGLLRMFRQLEEMKGGELLPALLEAIGRRHPGARSVPQDQMIQTFSEVIGQDLKPWFKERWNLGGTEALRRRRDESVNTPGTP